MFRKFSLKERPQGIAAVVHQNWDTLQNIIPLQGIWVVLDSIQDPGNLGSIMRTLDAVSGRRIILLGESTDGYHPTCCVRASMWTIFTLKMIKSSITDFIIWATKSPIFIVGTVCKN